MIKFKKMLTLLIITIICVLPTTSAFAAYWPSYDDVDLNGIVVNCYYLAVHSSPGVSEPTIDEIPRDTEVYIKRVTTIQYGMSVWYYIEYYGGSGWVSKDYIQLQGI